MILDEEQGLFYLDEAQKSGHLYFTLHKVPARYEDSFRAVVSETQTGGSAVLRLCPVIWASTLKPTPEELSLILSHQD